MDFAELIKPLLRRLCQYAMFKRAGAEVSSEELLSVISAELNAIALKCASVPALQERWQKIERPLIFFIDYTVKEGDFSFSSGFAGLARSFNEFSGDEKFFDLLDAAVRRGEDEEILRLFYVWLGLGFDGALKRERESVLRRMHQLKDKAPPAFDPAQQLLCPELPQEGAPAQPAAEQTGKGKSWFTLKRTVLILTAVAALSLLGNALSFYHAVSPFAAAVDSAAMAARPYLSSGEP